jgi:hypothetical protein
MIICQKFGRMAKTVFSGAGWESEVEGFLPGEESPG